MRDSIPDPEKNASTVDAHRVLGFTPAREQIWEAFDGHSVVGRFQFGSGPCSLVVHAAILAIVKT